jgi:hypothetical protein
MAELTMDLKICECPGRDMKREQEKIGISLTSSTSGSQDLSNSSKFIETK